MCKVLSGPWMRSPTTLGVSGILGVRWAAGYVHGLEGAPGTEDR